MKCPSCSQEVSLSSQSCHLCGTSLLPNVASTPQVAPLPVKPPSSSALRDVAFAIGSMLCWLFIIVLNMGVTKAHYGSLTPEAAGFFTGRCIAALILPAIIVWAIQRSSHRSISRAATFFAISAGAVFFALISAAGLSKRMIASDVSPEHIGLLAKEAIGQAPISPDKSVWDAPLRSFFADIKAFNDQYMQEAAAIDKSAFSELYSAKSFASQAAMQRTLSQLQAVRDVDARHASLEPMFEKLKAHVHAINTSDNEKDAFWKGFESTARPSLAPRTAVSEKGMKWMDSTIDLYQFTLANKNSYSVHDGKLFFRQGSGLDRQFNEKLQNALSLRKEFLEQQKIFHADQAAKLGQFGVTPSDMGIKSHENGKPQ